MDFRQDGANRHVFEDNHIRIELDESGDEEVTAKISVGDKITRSRYRTIDGAKAGSRRLAMFIKTMQGLVHRAKTYKEN